MASQASNMPQPISSNPLVSQKHKAIILMGATGAGKSTFINRIAGSDLAVNASLASCTQDVTSVKLTLEDGTLVELVDTPGFNDSVRSDIEILNEIATALHTWNERKIDIHGVIYLHRISDIRMSGSARKVFATFLNICGKDAMPHVSIVTNMWDSVPSEEGKIREAALFDNPLFFKLAIDSGAKVCRNDHPPQSIKEILREAIRPNPIELLIQKELSGEDRDLLKTTAGAELDKEMTEKRAQHEAELSKINRDHFLAQQQQDIETQEELEEEREMVRRKMGEMEALMSRLQEQEKAKAHRKQKSTPEMRHSHPRINKNNGSSHRSTTTEEFTWAAESCVAEIETPVLVSDPSFGAQPVNRQPEPDLTILGAVRHKMISVGHELIRAGHELIRAGNELISAGNRWIALFNRFDPVGPPVDKPRLQSANDLAQDNATRLSQLHPKDVSTSVPSISAKKSNHSTHMNRLAGEKPTLEEVRPDDHSNQSRSKPPYSGRRFDQARPKGKPTQLSGHERTR